MAGQTKQMAVPLRRLPSLGESTPRYDKRTRWSVDLRNVYEFEVMRW